MCQSEIKQRCPNWAYGKEFEVLCWMERGKRKVIKDEEKEKSKAKKPSNL